MRTYGDVIEDGTKVLVVDCVLYPDDSPNSALLCRSKTLKRIEQNCANRYEILEERQDLVICNDRCFGANRVHMYTTFRCLTQ